MDAFEEQRWAGIFVPYLRWQRPTKKLKSFRTLIKKTIADPAYKKHCYYWCLSTPWDWSFEQYVDYSAMSMYYNGNNGQQSKENAKKAKDVPAVIERSYSRRTASIVHLCKSDGEKATGAGASSDYSAKRIVLNRFQGLYKTLQRAFQKLSEAHYLKPVAKIRYGRNGNQGPDCRMWKVHSGQISGARRNIGSWRVSCRWGISSS